VASKEQVVVKRMTTVLAWIWIVLAFANIACWIASLAGIRVENGRMPGFPAVIAALFASLPAYRSRARWWFLLVAATVGYAVLAHALIVHERFLIMGTLWLPFVRRFNGTSWQFANAAWLALFVVTVILLLADRPSRWNREAATGASST
jgi:hypothetical protein